MRIISRNYLICSCYGHENKNKAKLTENNNNKWVMRKEVTNEYLYRYLLNFPNGQQRKRNCDKVENKN